MKTKTQNKRDSVCLNDQTVGNLKKYLNRFPDDAKVYIWHDYKNWDAVICCNFEHQEADNIVQIMLGQFISMG